MISRFNHVLHARRGPQLPFSPPLLKAPAATAKHGPSQVDPASSPRRDGYLAPDAPCPARPDGRRTGIARLLNLPRRMLHALFPRRNGCCTRGDPHRRHEVDPVAILAELRRRCPELAAVPSPLEL